MELAGGKKFWWWGWPEPGWLAPVSWPRAGARVTVADQAPAAAWRSNAEKSRVWGSRKNWGAPTLLAGL